MAAAVGEDAGVPGDRPGAVVLPRRGARADPSGPGATARPARRADIGRRPPPRTKRATAVERAGGPAAVSGGGAAAGPSSGRQKPSVRCEIRSQLTIVN